MPELGMHDAIWDDGEWVSWSSINSTLQEMELRQRYPNADLNLVPIFEDLRETASRYFHLTGKHLQVYGDLGELYGAIRYGIKLNKNYAKGSDGRLGDDLVEIKTITPFKRSSEVQVRLDRNFSKLLIVRIDRNFEVSGRMMARDSLPKRGGSRLRVNWDDLKDGE